MQWRTPSARMVKISPTHSTASAYRWNSAIPHGSRSHILIGIVDGQAPHDIDNPWLVLDD